MPDHWRHAYENEPRSDLGGKPNAWASVNPSNGMSVNWHANPMNTPPGILKTRAKSATLNVVP